MIDPTVIVSWPAAAVAIVVILAGAALQVVNIVMAHRIRQDTTTAAAQTQHNGGSTQRDEISVIRLTLEEHVDQDKEWKSDIERRLPPADPAP
jgi:hypothetical protein